jgi:plasmid maintenance system antidote protein VapI
LGVERAQSGVARHRHAARDRAEVFPLSVERTMKTKKLAPIHPGEILCEEFMLPRRINEIVMEKRSITVDTALRLARFFGTSAEMWAGLQADYDLRLARYEKEKQIERDVEPLAELLPAMA